MKKLVSIAFVVLLGVTLRAQERFVRPVDEAAKDPSFVAFRAKLIAAVERRDAAYLLSIVDRRIKNGFGGDDGIAAFKRTWKLTSKSSKFWSEFLAVIRNGGSFDSSGFVAPYSFTRWPDELDAFEHDMIFGSNVNLRERPDANARIVARLSHNVVKTEPETLPNGAKVDHPGWRRVRTLGGLAGFVKEDYVRSPIDFRAGFEKIRGRWKLTFWVAGD